MSTTKIKESEIPANREKLFEDIKVVVDMLQDLDKKAKSLGLEFAFINIVNVMERGADNSTGQTTSLFAPAHIETLSKSLASWAGEDPKALLILLKAADMAKDKFDPSQLISKLFERFADKVGSDLGDIFGQDPSDVGSAAEDVCKAEAGNDTKKERKADSTADNSLGIPKDSICYKCEFYASCDAPEKFRPEGE